MENRMPVAVALVEVKGLPEDSVEGLSTFSLNHADLKKFEENLRRAVAESCEPYTMTLDSVIVSISRGKFTRGRDGGIAIIVSGLPAIEDETRYREDMIKRLFGDAEDFTINFLQMIPFRWVYIKLSFGGVDYEWFGKMKV